MSEAVNAPSKIMTAESRKTRGKKSAERPHGPIERPLGP